MMREIGGFFELEFDKKAEYYIDSTSKVNSGRNAILYILQARKTKRVYVPYFTCATVLEPIQTLGLEYEFYAIDENLEINNIDSFQLKSDEQLIYINYFGIKNKYVDQLANKFSSRLIIDNTQAFFKKPLKNIDTCYSPRKFFGVPDGGYVFTTAQIDVELDKGFSAECCSALLGRIENNASEIYDLYKEHNKCICHRPLQKMSKLTENILSSLDYEKIRLIRERNFSYLHHRLEKYNKLKIKIDSLLGPMVYPLWVDAAGLRDFLIKNKIYVPRYWKEVLEYVGDINKIESIFTNFLLPIPIDQRYNLTDMQRIIETIENYFQNQKSK